MGIVCEVIASLILNGVEMVHLLPYKPCEFSDLPPLWMSTLSLLRLLVPPFFPLSLHTSLILVLSFIHSHKLIPSLIHTHTHTRTHTRARTYVHTYIHTHTQKGLKLVGKTGTWVSIKMISLGFHIPIPGDEWTRCTNTPST